MSDECHNPKAERDLHRICKVLFAESLAGVVWAIVDAGVLAAIWPALISLVAWQMWRKREGWRLLAVLGLFFWTMVLGMMLVLSVITLIARWPNDFGTQWIWTIDSPDAFVLAILVQGVLFTISYWMLVVLESSPMLELFMPPTRTDICLECGYPREGVTLGRCPECGTEYPSDS